MDNAFEKARAAYGTGAYDDATLEFLFPQLKESEEEKVRKEIISIVKAYRENCIDEGTHRFDDCLSWLEKQNHDGKKWITPAELNRLETLRYEAGFDDGVRSEKEKQKEQTENATKTLAKILKDSAEGFRRILKKKGIDYEVSDKFWENTAVVYSKEEDVEFHKWMDDLMGPTPIEETYGYKKGLEAGIKQKEQKPAEWSESDTVMCNAALELLRSHPNLMASHGINKSSVIRWLQSFRPQKQGFIDDICSKAGIAIPYLDGNQWCILKGDNIQAGVVGFGGTKEDALANFIKDVPIPQQWSEEDEAFLKVAIAVCNRYSHKDIADWLKSLPERFNPQPKQEWSEEDEKRIQSILFSVGYCKEEYPNKKDYSKDINWLKSLRPQPKQEVPVDTEVLTAKLVNLLKSYRIGEVTATGLANRIADTYGTQRYLDGLCDGEKGKWKPSEEQMKALKLAYEDAFECPEGGVPHLTLLSLLSDLQKLL